MLHHWYACAQAALIVQQCIFLVDWQGITAYGRTGWSPDICYVEDFHIPVARSICKGSSPIEFSSFNHVSWTADVNCVCSLHCSLTFQSKRDSEGGKNSCSAISFQDSCRSDLEQEGTGALSRVSCLIADGHWESLSTVQHSHLLLCFYIAILKQGFTIDGQICECSSKDDVKDSFREKCLAIRGKYQHGADHW